MTESQLHEAVCNYIRLQYPHALFNSDMSGIKLTMGQAIKAKKLRSSKGFPDLIIYKSNFLFKALFIELKKEGEKLFCADGVTFKTDHLIAQYNVMKKLKEEGYCAHFAIGFDNAKSIIDNYLTL